MVMARSDFSNEVSSAIEDATNKGNQPKENRPVSPGQQGNRSERPDVMRGRTADAGTQTRVPNPRVQAKTGTPRAAAAPDARVMGAMPADLHHVAAAADIAHSILGNRRMA